MSPIFGPSYLSLSGLRVSVLLHMATIMMLALSVQPGACVVCAIAWVMLYFASVTSRRGPPWRLLYDLSDVALQNCDAQGGAMLHADAVVAHALRSTGEKGVCYLLARYGGVCLVDLHWEGGDQQCRWLWPDAMSQFEWCQLSMKVALCLGM